MSQAEPLVKVENLTKHFPIMRGIVIQRKVGAVQAVDGISFAIAQGETLGLVGESGCGKTTAGRTLLALYPATAGQVTIDGHDVHKAKGRELLAVRRKAQIIFQDPYASLNPRWTVSAIVSEPIRVHKLCKSEKERSDRVKELLELVGLNARLINRFPHEFSGGQRQRIGVARALASEPKFIVCDEPISALDVSIQAQVVNLLEDLQDRLGLTYLFIAHDLSMVRHICDRVAVMYLGVIVELAERNELYENPLHPYTQALLSAVPIPDPKKDRARQRIILTGDVPSPINPPSGCRFHPRCPVATPLCSEVRPEWQDMGGNHWVACHPEIMTASDLVLAGGRIVDGCGNPWFYGDVGIRRGRIARIAPPGTLHGRQTLDVGGRFVAPGFVDVHTHSDLSILVNRQAESVVRQGVTTEVIGNCGMSPAPVSDARLAEMRHFWGQLAGAPGVTWQWRTFAQYLRTLQRGGLAINVASLAGHAALRIAVMGFEDRAPSPAELDRDEKAAGRGDGGRSVRPVHRPGLSARLFRPHRRDRRAVPRRGGLQRAVHLPHPGRAGDDPGRCGRSDRDRAAGRGAGADLAQRAQVRRAVRRLGQPEPGGPGAGQGPGRDGGQ